MDEHPQGQPAYFTVTQRDGLVLMAIANVAWWTMTKPQALELAALLVTAAQFNAPGETVN